MRVLKSIFFLLTIIISGKCEAQKYFRSIATGNWNAVATWQESLDLITWNAATTTPTSADLAVTVQSPNNVTINAAVTVDEITINSGATLTTTGAIVVTFNDGAGIDLIVNGTFVENSTTSNTWGGSATWQISSGGTLIRTQNTSSNFWQQRYSGGIASIPSTANWIVRKNGAANPSISTVAGVGGAYYPNLIIENNNAGVWTTATSSTFQGNTAYPTIKGNFDIGGAGTSTVDFLNQHTFATTTLVQGNLIIRTGNTLRNFGTGIQVQGNITINGTLSYDANDARRFECGGSLAQTFSGTGTVNIYELRMVKTANDLTLSRAITVDNILTLTTGRIFTTTTNLLLLSNQCSAVGANNNSFVHGPVRKYGNTAFVFPTGKNSYYRSIAYGNNPSASIYSEDFGTACATGTPTATAFGWTQTSGANGADANVWYVTARESGLTSGTCGQDCTTGGPSDRTLHVGSATTSLGDIGAAYDAGGLCGFLTCPLTDKRIESPTINCSGRNNLSLGFRYMENGAGTNDNATLWYFDGTTWSQLSDPPKTATGCGSGQGLWTAYSVALPASANNNANVKIGFRWVNNDDGAGTDPSFAVDSIRVSEEDIFTAEYFAANPQVPYGNILAPGLDHISQCEYWILDRQAGTGGRTVTLSWNTPSSCGVTSNATLSELRVARYDGISTWQNHGNGGTTGTFVSGTVITSAAVTAFSPFTLASVTTNNPLPVELISFDAVKRDKNSVLCSWITASEINNDYFELQRCSDVNALSENFQTIATIPGHGTTSVTNYYQHLDLLRQHNNIIYYRLKQFDQDGTFTYSPVKAVKMYDENCTAALIQNPVSDIILLKFNCDQPIDFTVNVYDAMGKEVFSENFVAGADEKQITLKDHSSALYTIQIVSPYYVKTLKAISQR